MTKTLKTLLALAATIAASLIALPASAQTVLPGTVTAATAASALTDAAMLTDIYWINSTTNLTTVKLYDSSTTATNAVRAAYTSYSPYSTNWSVLSTNAYGIVITNTFSGVYFQSTANTAVTNERPRVLTFTVPASSVRTLSDVNLSVARGLTILSDQNGTYNITYRPQ